MGAVGGGTMEGFVRLHRSSVARRCVSLPARPNDGTPSGYARSTVRFRAVDHLFGSHVCDWRVNRDSGLLPRAEYRIRGRHILVGAVALGLLARSRLDDP